MATKIITDSTSYIPKELIENLDIYVIPLNVIIKEKSYKETELNNKDFYKLLDELVEIPTSSQPALNDIQEIFTSITQNDNEVIGIFLSSKMSGTYSTANLVKNMIIEENPNAKIEILDSESNCMQMGFMVVEAAKAAKEGKSSEEIINIALKVRNNSRFLFTPNTLRYLKKGGRIGGAEALFGSLLKIKPILTVENGVTTVFEKVRTRHKAIDEIVKKVFEDNDRNRIKGIIVHNINCEEEGKILRDRIKEKIDLDIKIQQIGPIIGIHVGPGSIGVAYYT